MEQVRAPEVPVVGLRVRGSFAELGTLVPRAWRALAEAGLDRDVTWVELSRRLPDGGYDEVIGAVDEEGAGAALRAALGDRALAAASFPAGEVVRVEHDGPVEEIAESFGRAMDWAQGRGLRPTGELLDSGYRLDGGPETHVLWVRVETG